MVARQASDISLLLVDDEPVFRDTLAFGFKRGGYQVLSASNGREAFELVTERPVDAIISDIRMPGGCGVELLDRLRARHVEAPVIMLVTGYAELTTEQAHDKGAEALFTKPFDRRLLEQELRRLLLDPRERWSREEEREGAELAVEISFQGLPEAVAARVVSFGRGGMFVALERDRFPEVNGKTRFRIGFGGGAAPFAGGGVVRWVRTAGSPGYPPGCGIEFTYFGEGELERALELVSRRKTRAYIPIS